MRTFAFFSALILCLSFFTSCQKEEIWEPGGFYQEQKLKLPKAFAKIAGDSVARDEVYTYFVSDNIGNGYEYFFTSWTFEAQGLGSVRFLTTEKSKGAEWRLIGLNQFYGGKIVSPDSSSTTPKSLVVEVLSEWNEPSQFLSIFSENNFPKDTLKIRNF